MATVTAAAEKRQEKDSAAAGEQRTETERQDVESKQDQGRQRGDLLLEVRNLKTYFHSREGTLKAVDDVSFEVYRGRTLGVVGESGCGKSVTSQSVMRLIPSNGSIEGGQILLHGERGAGEGGGTGESVSKGAGQRDGGGAGESVSKGAGDGGGQSESDGGRVGRDVGQRDGVTAGDGGGQVVDLAQLEADGEEIRAIRGRTISMVFQEPMTSFSPVIPIGIQIAEVIELHQGCQREEALQRAAAILGEVGMPRPEQQLDTYPFSLSGGMCQRAMIAMALSCRPELVIADEPTSALDVTTQAQILELLKQLQEEYRMAVMIITHDLGVVAETADDVLVMYLGESVEYGPVREIFHHPKHPYTRGLLASVPKLGSRSKERLVPIEGSVPSLLERPTGCPFHTRCPEAIEGRCDATDPPEVEVSPGHRVKCHLFAGDGQNEAAAAQAQGGQREGGQDQSGREVGDA